jgi:hypothetical protein
MLMLPLANAPLRHVQGWCPVMQQDSCWLSHEIHQAVCVYVAWCVVMQPLYKRLFGFEVFGLGFMTSVVSG